MADKTPYKKMKLVNRLILNVNQITDSIQTGDVMDRWSFS